MTDPRHSSTAPERIAPRRAAELLPRFLRRAHRRFWGHLGRSPFHVVYHDQYTAAFPDVPNDPLRAERILAFLVSESLLPGCSIHRPEAVWLKALARVHTSEYLDSIHDIGTLTSIMGVEINESQVDRLIDYQRLQTGGTLMATRSSPESCSRAIGAPGETEVKLSMNLRLTKPSNGARRVA